jgi:hypothetical protein
MEVDPLEEVGKVTGGGRGLAVFQKNWKTKKVPWG